MSNDSNISDAVVDILDEIECNIYVDGDDTWGDSAICDREYLSEYITNKIKELMGDK